ncbi:MAG: hypothetical protein EOP37_19635 [Rubrivivax sp.]|nr:MAG: hypothetical protein EOP37_19635 [Rubrivivax sp.]
MKIHHLVIAGGVAYLTARFMRPQSSSAVVDRAASPSAGSTDRESNGTLGDAARRTSGQDAGQGINQSNSQSTEQLRDRPINHATNHATSQTTNQPRRDAQPVATARAGQDQSGDRASSTPVTAQAANASRGLERPALGLPPGQPLEGNPSKAGVAGLSSGA